MITWEVGDRRLLPLWSALCTAFIARREGAASGSAPTVTGRLLTTKTAQDTDTRGTGRAHRLLMWCPWSCVSR